MGPQSQRLVGSIKKCKQRATNRNKKRKVAPLAFKDGVVFVPDEHCKVCLSRKQKEAGRDVNVPKRAHHRLCPLNRSNQHKKSRLLTDYMLLNGSTGQVSAPRAVVFGANEVPKVSTTTAPELGNHQVLTTDLVNPNGQTNQAKTRPTVTPDGFFDCRDREVDLATDIRLELESRMKLVTDGTNYEWAAKISCPIAISLAIDYLVGTFTHRRPKDDSGNLPQSPEFQRALGNYNKLFPTRTLEFRFPPDLTGPGNPPSPLYHQVEGEAFMYLDWHLAFPGTKLPCPDCHCAAHPPATPSFLSHERTNWSKSHTLFPIWGTSGTPTWLVVMWYSCGVCKARVRGNDGRLLQLLPDHVRRTYPVPPRYATGLYHLHKIIVEVIESNLKTYANADFVSSHLHRRQGRKYCDKVATYLSQEAVKSFVDFDDFIGNTRPPSGSSLRALYEEAEYSPLTPYGISNVERYHRELQAVNVGETDILAFDHTFAALKCYGNLPNAKAIFTGMKGNTKEVVSLGIVPSTSLSDAAHLLQKSFSARQKFLPAVVYTDTCPHGKDFWEALFGPRVETKLGLFHFIHRIVDTMDNKSELFWDAMVKLKSAIYTYHAGDEAALFEALKDGSFSRSNKQYTDQEIDQMRCSKQWKANCEPYLRKAFRTEQDAKTRLTSWIGQFEFQTDHKGRAVFSHVTPKVTREQVSKIKHVLDSENAVTYHPIPPGPRTQHNLVKWASNRPESSLERFHGLLAHFANCGSSTRLADALCLRGTAEYNVACRLRAHNRSERNDGQIITTPRYLENSPVFLDHSLLEWLNSKATARNLAKPFRFVTPTTNNNGEVFLSSYLEQQLVRNDHLPALPGPQLCQCLECDRVRFENPVNMTLERPSHQDSVETEFDDDNNVSTLEANIEGENDLPVQVPMVPTWQQ